MKAIVIRSIGGPIEWAEVARPALPAAASICDRLAAASLRETGRTDVCGEGMVIMGVRMAGISYADYLGMHGELEKKPRPPLTPGAEACGVVEAAVNSGKFRVGDKAGAVMPWTCGTCAEALLLHDYQCVVLPATSGKAEFAEFVGLGADYVTAFFALKHRSAPILKGGMWQGRALLVLGTAGGVGVAAVEIGACLGASVFACAPKAREVDYRRSAPDVRIDSTKRGWHAAVLAARPSGVEVAFDPVGGDAIFSVIRCLKVGGALLTVGFASGRVPTVSLEHLLQRNIGIHGVWTSPFQYPRELEDSAAAVVALWAEKRLTPAVTTVLPMDKFRNGIAMLVVRDYKHKVALAIESPDWARASPATKNPTVRKSAQSTCPDEDAPDAASLMRYFPGDAEDASLEDEHTGVPVGIHGDY